MSESVKLNVRSEIGKLKTVLLHKPGRELDKLTPDLLRALLFDDIPWLQQMRAEHDEFADILRGRGVEVLYVEKLLTEVLADKAVKRQFARDIIQLSHIENESLQEALVKYISAKSAADVTDVAIAGLMKSEAEDLDYEMNLWSYFTEDYPMYIDPVPNLYFTRDPAAVIGNGFCINKMFTEARRREPLLIRYIYEHHPVFAENKGLIWYDEKHKSNIEGGDTLILSKDVVAIGCSQRTSAGAIETLAKKLFAEYPGLREVLAIQIPALREFMHLDTVFTMIDHDVFTVYPGIIDRIQVYRIMPGANGEVKIKIEADLSSALKNSLGLGSVRMIESGGGDEISAAREQWNDSTNTLAIEPGVVVTYSRNERTNESLRESGVEVLEINGSELARGRGGPRCMSCPLEREELE
ncbi:MAG: arginine deiminase [Clostridiales Family XIII bacterium]|nr:arginine deiminase [Clostridiales Family XIII bacterium]